MSAPLALNVQPWAFVAVTQGHTLDELCRSLPYTKMLDKAGAAIVVCVIPEKERHICQRLLGHGLFTGIRQYSSRGTCPWFTARYGQRRMRNSERVREVRRILAIPVNIIPLIVMPIGCLQNKDLKPLDKFKRESIHWEKW